MKRLSMIITLFSALCLFGYDLIVCPTLMVNLTDQIKFVMPNRGLQITTVSKVERQQPFSLNIAIGLKKPLEHELKLIGDVVITAPDGKQSTIVKEKEFFVLPAGARGLIFSKSFLSVSFDPPDKNGRYQFSVILKNASGEVKSQSAEVELVDAVTNFELMDFKEFDQLLTCYYQTPKPERLLAALNYFLNEGVIKLRSSGKSANALSVLWCFANIFRSNPQFFDELAKMSGSDHPKDQYLAILFYAIGKEFTEPYRAQINPHILKQISRYKKPLLSENDEIKFPQQLDLLWGEFFAAGKFSSIQRISSALQKKPELSIQEAKIITAAGKELTGEQKQLLINSLIKRTAVWSLQSNISRNRHPLARFYLETICARKLYPDEQAAQLICGILKNKKSTQGNKK